MPDEPLRHKTVLVAGTARHIGHSLALVCAHAGANTVIHPQLARPARHCRSFSLLHQQIRAGSDYQTHGIRTHTKDYSQRPGARSHSPTIGQENKIGDHKNLSLKHWAKEGEIEQALFFFLTCPEYITGEIIHVGGG